MGSVQPGPTPDGSPANAGWRQVTLGVGYAAKEICPVSVLAEEDFEASRHRDKARRPPGDEFRSKNTIVYG